MKILVAILSCCNGHQVRRDAQRETWVKQLSPLGVDYRFFVGSKDCQLEKDFGGSDLFGLDCDDTYAGLPGKMRSAAAWALRHGYDYLFKCDDDTYVRSQKLLRSGFEAHDYSGFIEDRDFALAVNFPVYAHAQGGPGYWLSRYAMELVAQHTSSKLQEDFAVGEAVGQAGIVPFHNGRYCHENRPVPRERILRFGSFISLHKCDPQEMRRVHAQRQSFCPIGAE